MEKVKNILFAALLAVFAAALLLFPAQSADAAREGLSLCFRSVLPSLFPFFVLSSLLVSGGAAESLGRALEPVMRPLFYLGGAGAGALSLGLVGGYPVGARTVAELYRAGRLPRVEAERLLGFCNNAGPGFILGICGGTVLQSARAGAYLYLVHAASAVLTGVLLRRGALLECDAARRAHRAGGNGNIRSRGAEGARGVESARTHGAEGARSRGAKNARLRGAGNGRTPVAAFTAAVRDSFAAVWSVCGYVVLFAVLLRFVTLLLPERPLLVGFIELTNGVLSLPSGRGGFILCAVLLGWGGLSVHAQTLSVLEDTGLSARWYFTGKAVQAALSAPLALLVANWLY